MGTLPGTGIIYTLTKRDANQVANWLNQHGISARAYVKACKVSRDGTQDHSKAHPQTNMDETPDFGVPSDDKIPF